MRKPLNIVLLAAIASATVACNNGTQSSSTPPSNNTSNLSFTLTPVSTSHNGKTSKYCVACCNSIGYGCM